MTRPPWAALAVSTAPVLAGAVIVSATLGAVGAIAYTVVLLAGVNTAHHLHRKDNR